MSTMTSRRGEEHEEGGEDGGQKQSASTTTFLAQLTAAAFTRAQQRVFCSEPPSPLCTLRALGRIVIMEAHPTFAGLAPLFPRYSPAIQGAAFQTYNDLMLSQRWADLRVLDLPACVRCAFEGVPPNSDCRAVVVPCALAERISMDWLDRAFEGTDRPEKIFLAIVSDDSSIVYYKLTAGVNKPPV